MSDVPTDFNAPFLPIRRFAAAANSSAATVRPDLTSRLIEDALNHPTRSQT